MADSFDESPFSSQKTHASSLKRVLLIVLVLLLSGVAIFAISQLTAQKPSTKSFAPTPTQQPTPTEIPSPTASASATPAPSGKITPSPTPRGAKPTGATGLDRASITIAVQNGSGITGAAKKASDYLTGLGYTVSSTGNADANDYIDVSISVKAADAKFLPLLKTDLAKEYTVGSTAATLPASSRTNAVVIIGK